MEHPKCTQCGVKKKVGDFYKNKLAKSGRSSYCKDCYKKYDRERYYRSRDERMAQEHERSKRPEARARRLVAGRRMRLKSPEKWKARQDLRNAVARGKLERLPCEVANECVGRIEGHHDDYSKPLSVRWLCKKHHSIHHRKFPDLSPHHQ